MSRNRYVLSIVASLVGAAVAGSGLAMTISRVGSNTSGDTSTGYDEQRSVSTFAFSLAPGATASTRGLPTPVAAASAREAVESFLAAEVAGDFDESWRRLSAADRATVDSPAEWRRAHATWPAVTGFQVIRVADDSVIADVRYTPDLDETLGLVPARARLDLETVVEDDGHRVVWFTRRTTPMAVDPSGAVAAAQTWVKSRRGCDRPDNEWRGGLIGHGAPAAAEAVCRNDAVRVGADPLPLLDRYGIEPFVASFGSQISSWARTVRITGGGVDLDLVLAPIGDQWVVIGAISVSSERSG